jgi:hypothetical protein
MGFQLVRTGNGRESGRRSIFVRTILALLRAFDGAEPVMDLSTEDLPTEAAEVLNSAVRRVAAVPSLAHDRS